MTSQGFTTPKDYEQGIRELVALPDDPGAFMMGPTFLAIGYVASRGSLIFESSLLPDKSPK